MNISIANYREAQGLTQAAFGALFGVTQGQVSKWENGQDEVSPRLGRLIEDKTAGTLKRQFLCPSTWQKFWPELEQNPCDT
jgi:transcriptional regulator with XRE-family HTH domain